jgi:tRNA dimethylallyltransferase
MKDARLIFIVGPTAVGKSEIALYVAKQLNAEIVSCDALQVYKEIAVASDKPSLQVRAAVAHHLIDVVSVTEDFNVARWRQLASAAVEDIQSRGKTPLIAGGSGMYMAVLLDGIFEEIEIEETIRKELDLGLLIHGPGVLHQRLQTLDPKAAAKIHPHDSRRVMRALGVTLAQVNPFLTCKANGMVSGIKCRLRFSLLTVPERSFTSGWKPG